MISAPLLSARSRLSRILLWLLRVLEVPGTRYPVEGTQGRGQCLRKLEKLNWDTPGLQGAKEVLSAPRQNNSCSPIFPLWPKHSPTDIPRNGDFHLRMAEQKSGGKNEGNEERASMQQQQLIALHSINTGYHLLSTDYIPSMGLSMRYLL